MAVRGQIGGDGIDDVAVPAGHVTAAEIPVDGVEHDGSGAVDVLEARGPYAIFTHLHIIGNKGRKTDHRITAPGLDRDRWAPQN
ncbi:hypothetical protein GCM10010269_66980 [Streptomyces humidus]|uniref:Uncharacterized protein n=1 Tax=Streptomyces humidus TaxID=52259 RepID=A0A918G4H7_9ACTN|nr:hypothetical protein GCM10010269_66980 [Streptomyces humidus]